MVPRSTFRQTLATVLGPPGPVATAGAWAGAVLLVWSAVIHLHLWSLGYHEIPTIGPLFLVQGIAGIVIAVVVAIARRALLTVAAALFALGTIGGLLVSVNVGLFGFTESLSAPYVTESLVVEAVASALLLGSAVAAVRHRHPAIPHRHAAARRPGTVGR